LDIRPGSVISQTGILGLNPDQICIAVDNAFPVPPAGVVGAARGKNKIGAVSAKPKLCERARKVGAAFDQRIEAGHGSIPGSSGVVAQDTHDPADVATPTVLPSVNQGYLEAGALQYIR